MGVHRDPAVCERPGLSTFLLPNGTVAATGDWTLSTVMARLVTDLWFGSKRVAA